MSIHILKKYWFEELGCSGGGLIPGRVVVSPHGNLKGYSGVLFFKIEDALVISAPDHLVKNLRDQTHGMDSTSCFENNFVASLLKDQIDRIIGPAWIGQIDSEWFHKNHGPETRLLSGEDWGSLAQLLSDSPEIEKSHSSLQEGRSPTVGVFDGHTLVAAAGYGVLSGSVAHIGVLTHPQHRGKGLATQAVSGITEVALTSDLGIQYRTLLTNTAALAAAKRVGFRNFAETIAVRIK